MAEQIVLGNSTSHGLHLIANGLPWTARDEVLVIEGDYPATDNRFACDRRGSSQADGSPTAVSGGGH